MNAPVGLMATKVYCVMARITGALADSDVSLRMNTSKQFIIHFVLVYFGLKQSGNVS